MYVQGHHATNPQYFSLEFVSNQTWTFASQRDKQAPLVSGPQSMWICQNYLLDVQQCQTFAHLTATHH